jgi:hypothetical protein
MAVSMIVLRLIGLVLVGLAVWSFGLDCWNATTTSDGFRLAAAGEFWFHLHAASLNGLQAAVQRYVHPALWDDVLQPVLLWPAILVGGVPGLLLLLVPGGRRERPSGFRNP